MCPDMTVEDAFFKAIGQVEEYVRVDGTLILRTTSGQVLFVLIQKKS